VFVIWQRIPRVQMCCYRITREEAEMYVAEQMKKQPNGVFDIGEMM